jgi:hypothetical protein
MKLVKGTAQNNEVMELRGRQERGEEGEEGLWLVWVVGSAFLGGGALFWQTGEYTSTVVSVVCGIIGTAILALGVCLALKRERLTLDLRRRRGLYSTWSPWGGTRVQQEFGFDQVDCLALQNKAESVDGQLYEKLELRLRVRPRSVIRIARSKDERKVRELARELSTALGVGLLDRTRQAV